MGKTIKNGYNVSYSKNSRRTLRRGENLYDMSSGLVYRVGSGMSFAVIVLKGHVERGFGIPAIYGIEAGDRQSAIDIARSLAFVKRNQPILACQEISKEERVLISSLGDFDKVKDPTSKMIIVPTVIDSKRDKDYLENRYGKIKTVDDFEESDILQKYLAPLQFGDKIIRNDIGNRMNDLLAEYYTRKVKVFGKVLNPSTENIKLLSLYVEIFGLENPLNIHYEKENAKLSYLVENKLVKVDVPEQYVEYLNNIEPSKRMKKINDAFNKVRKKYKTVEENKNIIGDGYEISN